MAAARGRSPKCRPRTGVRYVVWSQGCALACPSHFTRVRTALREPDLLIQALTTLGFTTAETHDTPQTLYGYQGDARPERAEVIIRRVAGARGQGERLGALLPFLHR